MSFVAPIAGVLNNDTSKSSRNGNGFLEDDLDSDGDTAMQEPSGSTSVQKDHSNVDRLPSVISLIRELVRHDATPDISISDVPSKCDVLLFFVSLNSNVLLLPLVLGGPTCSISRSSPEYWLRNQ